MTTADLKAMLDEPVLVIRDDRKGKHASSSEFKGTGATRVAGRTSDSWAGICARNQNIVIYDA